MKTLAENDTIRVSEIESKDLKQPSHLKPNETMIELVYKDVEEPKGGLWDEMILNQDELKVLVLAFAKLAKDKGTNLV